MADNIRGIPFSTSDEGKPYPQIALHILRTLTNQQGYIVWFAYTLGSWKALCSTPEPDGRYYEITFDSRRNVAYVDTYLKIDNKEIQLS